MVEPPITTIAPDDPWWDDLAAPVTLDNLTGTLLRAYDVYTQDPKTSGDVKALEYRIDDQNRRHIIYYEIVGTNPPVFMYIKNSVLTLDIKLCANCVIDRRALSRGEIVTKWYDVISDMPDADYAETVLQELREECVRRNMAVSSMSKDDLMDWFDIYVCIRLLADYVEYWS